MITYMHTLKGVHRSLIVREVTHTTATGFLLYIVYIVYTRSFSEITCFLLWVLKFFAHI